MRRRYDQNLYSLKNAKDKNHQNDIIVQCD